MHVPARFATTECPPQPFTSLRHRSRLTRLAGHTLPLLRGRRSRTTATAPRQRHTLPAASVTTLPRPRERVPPLTGSIPAAPCLAVCRCHRLSISVLVSRQFHRSVVPCIRTTACFLASSLSVGDMACTVSSPSTSLDLHPAYYILPNASGFLKGTYFIVISTPMKTAIPRRAKSNKMVKMTVDKNTHE